MKTVRLYQKNVYQKEAEAKVLRIEKFNGNTLLFLDQTIFFPTGGGQSCDLGKIKVITDYAQGNDMALDNYGYQVIDVYEFNDEICHVIRAINDFNDKENCYGSQVGAKHQLHQGDKVKLLIDWERRFDNMQRHCGEHIMSGMFFREYGGVNRGFHMGDDYMTIDIDLSGTGYDRVTWEMAKRVEWCTNEAIWENLPVVTTHYNTKAEAEKEPLRKALTINSDITIVRIGSAENPSDAVACCGTHPAMSGQVGMVKIFKLEPNKGMTRIYLEAGQRAFRKYQEEFDSLTEISEKLSAGKNDLIEKFEAKEEKMSEIKDRLYHLEKRMLEIEANEAVEKITKQAEAKNNSFTILSYSDYDLSFLQSLGKQVSSSTAHSFVIVDSNSNTCMLFSKADDIDCGAIVKGANQNFSGKGGGGKSSARVSFPNADSIKHFLESLIR